MAGDGSAGGCTFGVMVGGVDADDPQVGADGDDEFQSLLEQARGGSAWAWQQLFEEFAPRVAGYLRVQGAVDVDDLVSEVFIGVANGIDSFEGSRSQLCSWVFVIAHRRLTDQRRRRYRAPVGLSRDELDLERADPVDAESAAMEQMSTAEVVALCDRLVPDQRDVLLLRIVGDLSVAQVSAVTGKSEGAVKALQHRGVRALQRILSAGGVPR